MIGAVLYSESPMYDGEVKEWPVIKETAKQIHVRYGDTLRPDVYSKKLRASAPEGAVAVKQWINRPLYLFRDRDECIAAMVARHRYKAEAHRKIAEKHDAIAEGLR